MSELSPKSAVATTEQVVTAGSLVVMALGHRHSTAEHVVDWKVSSKMSWVWVVLEYGCLETRF